MTEHRSGRTAEAMRAAPRAAMFIWCNNSLSYPRGVARWLKRTDLVIVRPCDVEAALKGFDAPVIVDHNASLPAHIRLMVDAANLMHAQKRIAA